MKIKFSVINSLHDKMFDVEIDSIYVSVIVANWFDSYDMIYCNGEYINGPAYKAMKYEDFKKIADDIYI